MGLTRYWTVEEGEAVKAALPAALKPLVDELYLIKRDCWHCQEFDAGHCKTHDREIPIDRRKEEFECWSYPYDDPF